MPRAISLVHLEDSTTSTRRLASLLEADGLPCDLRGVQTEDDFRHLLASGRVDLGLYTCRGGAADPVALTRRILGSAVSCPLIALVTFDDSALEAGVLNAGATDCVPAWRLGRLGWAIRRALLERDEAVRRAQVEEELRNIQAQLHHARRLGDVAHIVGGIAHDFNNLLTVINGSCQMLVPSVPAGDERRPVVEMIEQAGMRGTELTKRLISFSRRESDATSLVNLNDVIVDAQPVLTALLSETQRLSLNLDPSIWLVRADSSEMIQILLNLVTNARDAISDGGAITIRTGTVDLFSGRDGRSTGSHVELVVRDSGCGMEEHVRSRIFDPLFTTKTGGEGTGLGLATVYRIVSHSGGQIDVETAVGRGTTMRVRLPRAEGTDAAPHPPNAGDLSPTAGAERVLVVEDERPVRTIISSILRASGYRVLEAGDANAGIAMCNSVRGAVDLLISDVVLPGMSGPQMADILRDAVPGLKRLFISGYPADAVPNLSLDRTTAFLSKPFTREALLKKVRDLIASPAGSSS